MIQGVHGVFDPVVVTNPSRLQSLAKHTKEEMDSSEAVRKAAIHEERILQEARQRENVHQEGALGTIPQGHGIVPPRVAGANEEEQRQNQHAAKTTTSASLFSWSHPFHKEKISTPGRSSRPL